MREELTFTFSAWKRFFFLRYTFFQHELGSFPGGAYAMYQYLKLAMIIKFIAYKILVIKRYFNFFRFSSFDFQDLCVVAVLVAIPPPTADYSDRIRHNAK